MNPPDQSNVETAAIALHSALTVRDPYTAQHNSQTERIAAALAARIGFEGGRMLGVRIGARLHDIGKLGVPGDLLAKPGRLSDLEMQLVRRHTVLGHEIVKGIVSPWPIQQMVRSHHERLDGSGYPDGLSESGICVEARIIAVADAVDAMTSNRGYRSALPKSTVAAELRSARGRQLDPAIVDACLDLLEAPDFLPGT